MSLFKRLKEAFLGKPKKEITESVPVKKAPIKKVAPKQISTEKKTKPVQKAPVKEQTVKKETGAKKAVPKQNKKNQSGGNKKETQKIYNDMHAVYSEVKKHLMQKETDKALPKIRKVISVCLDMEIARHNLPQGAKADTEKLEAIKKTGKVPENIINIYGTILKRTSPEKEKEFINQKAQGEGTIRALGTVINYEKSEIFKKKAKKAAAPKGQPKQKKEATQPKQKKEAPQSKKKTEQNKLSFKAREERYIRRPVSIDTEEIYQKLDKAKEFIRKNNADDALTNIRRGLEIMATRLCEKYNIMQEGMTLENKIDALRGPVPLSQGQANVFHKARILSNKGSHYSDRAATISEAEEALGLANKVLEMYTEILKRQKSNAPADNIPLRNPDYYSPNRKYYGRWYTCNTRQALSMNSDFMKLQAEAEKGDIQAMLDIASGFLPTNIYWSEVSLIKHPDNGRCCDPYDARYYYWITRACATAYNDWQAGKGLPLPYLATALLEGLKFYVYYDFHLHHPANLNGFPDNQYIKVVQYMFGKFHGCAENFADMLLAMMREYAPDNLICTAHDERTEEYVKFLMYLTKIRWKNRLVYARLERRRVAWDASQPVDAKYAIRKEDTTIRASRAIENYHDFVFNLHHAYYNTILQRYKSACEKSRE